MDARLRPQSPALCWEVLAGGRIWAESPQPRACTLARSLHEGCVHRPVPGPSSAWRLPQAPCTCGNRHFCDVPKGTWSGAACSVSAGEGAGCWVERPRRCSVPRGLAIADIAISSGVLEGSHALREVSIIHESGGRPPGPSARFVPRAVRENCLPGCREITHCHSGPSQG